MGINLRKSNVVVTLLALACLGYSERINHAGRILGPQATVTVSTLFNTAEADAIISTLQIMPRDNAWNEDISKRPLLSNSTAMINQIISDLVPAHRHLDPEMEMNYVLVPDNQPLVPIPFLDYPDESDPGPYPIPDNMPIEGWPAGWGLNGQTLSQWQHDVYGLGGDRHGIILRPSDGAFFETWQMLRLQDQSWQASNGALWNINSNALRPFGWTSADAAGLAMLPALVRYDECQRGEIEHAVRMVVKHTRLGPIYPAEHNASSPPTNDPNVPAMGQRLRLKAGFQVPSGWTKEEKAVCAALKKYGGLVADNGNYFSFSICPDDRFAAGCFDDLTSITINNFEVVQSTGEHEGPRSPNPPTADAGADATAIVNTPLLLNGIIGGGTSNPAVTWYLYSGPAAVTFSNPNSAMTNATFSQQGVYTLMLKADDGVHTPGYDAVVVTVSTQTLLNGLSVQPSTVVGGNNSTGTVTLSSAAPAGGSPVSLSSSDPAAVVPGNVTVPAGQTSATFTVSTNGVAATKQVTITAQQGAVSKTAPLSITPAALHSFSVNPNPVVGGYPVTGTVSLNGFAPPGGAVVAVSDNTTVISTPPSMTISAGASTGSFVASTSPVGTSIVRTITVQYGTDQITINLTLNPGPVLSSFTFSPSTLAGGNPTTGKVTLTQAATGDGLVVSLSSASSVLSVPPSVRIPGGATSATFTAGTGAVSSSVTRTATATLGSVSKGASVTLNPASLIDFVVSPSTVKGGQNTSGRVTLDAPAPGGGAVVNLSSNSAVITVPASVTVPAGSRSATFTIKTSAVSQVYVRQVSASRNGVLKVVNITITP